MAAVDKKIDKIDDEIDEIQNHLAQCRMADQKKDHDILIKEHGRITTNEFSLHEFKKENKEQHNEMNENQKVISVKLEQVSGNLNQSMLMLTDLKKTARIKVGLHTAVVAGVLSTIIAALIIYTSSFLFNNVKDNLSSEDSTRILLDISSQLNHNTNQLKKMDERIEVKNAIIIEDK